MSSMDKLPHTSNTTSPWDLSTIASMDTENRYPQVLCERQNEGFFPFISLPTWQNYPPLPPPPLPPFVVQGSRALAKQMETLVEENGKEGQLVEEDQEEVEDEDEELGAMKEMMYKIAAMQPVEIDPATIRRPKRRNVRISDDPQSVAARLRRERISEKIRILQRLVPGGTKLDTASMLEEAVRYVKFLKRQIRNLQNPHQAQRATTATATATTSVAPITRGFEGELPLCFSFSEG